MARRKILDLFCGIGGAGMGYLNAGFDVTGVDKENLRHAYPGKFVHGSALDYLVECGHLYDFIHASCPCHRHTPFAFQSGTQENYPDYIPATRELLRLSGKPYVMENVTTSTLRQDLVLCGEMFGLRVIRHRAFEFGRFKAPVIEHIPHREEGLKGRGHYKDNPNGYYLQVYGNGGNKGSLFDWQEAMGIDWTQDRHGISQAIPPAYTKFIGDSVMEWMDRVKVI